MKTNFGAHFAKFTVSNLRKQGHGRAPYLNFVGTEELNFYLIRSPL